MEKLIITVLGKDRPGIIAKVSAGLYALDCNLQNVNQMILQNEFSGFFIVEPPETLNMETLQQRLDRDLSGEGLQIYIDQMSPLDTKQVSGVSETFLITTIGPDQKGLVARFTKIIADHGVNVTNLTAVFKGGNDPNANIMVYEIAVTHTTDQTHLFEALRAKASTLGLDISIQHKNIFETINKI
ncbi:glycine cleavage system transcriptional repressor [Desulfocicer vacuolatum DSM 3385]|uniref:Glycine cleavage system transcriptional repressor n=1 Tax=Desulfocicer vacuolatum DSM 3385 TaxID=1121400 RepID=A0A1W2AF45_9BACT|nr:ACT domain-containing protein [Desulfocicer vacuolatum]SMC59200.1 glycine cleavage system transcriptional repressor [Desulfocicer vacuolatum DSM 3385]